MVVQEKCEYILMLCEFFEKGVNKCATYWPMQNGTAEYGDVKVYCVSATAVSSRLVPSRNGDFRDDRAKHL